MCLRADYDNTMEWRKRTGTAVMYKVYRVLGDSLDPPYFGKPIKAPGTVTSNRKSAHPRIRQAPWSYSHPTEVNRGIHVFTTAKAAHVNKPHMAGAAEGRVVPVRVRWSDFVATDPSREQAVFMKVHISKTAFAKAVKQGKR